MSPMGFSVSFGYRAPLWFKTKTKEVWSIALRDFREGVTYYLLHSICSVAGPSCQPSARFAGPRPCFAYDLGPFLHGMQNRDLALLPQAVVPHPQVELVEAAAVPAVGPRIGGPCGTAPLGTEQIGDGGLRVACHEALDHGNTAQDIIDVQMYRLGMVAQLAES